MALNPFEIPFGIAKSRRILGKGMVLYKIKKDEYIYAAPELNNKIPKKLRNIKGWYSYPAAHVLAMEFPNYFPIEAVTIAAEYYRVNFPSIYEELAGAPVVILPTKHTSVEKHREHFFHLNRNKYIELAAWNSSDPNVDEGTVLIEAALGGDARQDVEYFLVTENDYLKNRTDYGFICIPGVHEIRDLEE